MTPEEKQNWVDQMICPECKERYPERSIAYETVRGLRGHRYFRHGVLYPGSVSAFPQNADGTFSCTDCEATGFLNPAMAGKHMRYAHGKRGKWSGNRKPAQKKRSAEAQLILPKILTAARAPDTVVTYLFGRAEKEIEDYAKTNGLVARELKQQVGALLQAN